LILKTSWILSRTREGVPSKSSSRNGFAVVDEAANDLHGGGVFVSDFVQVTVVEGEDLGAGVSEQDGGVGGDDELGVFVAAKGVVDEDKERELALWGEGGFGLVEEKENCRSHHFRDTIVVPLYFAAAPCTTLQKCWGSQQQLRKSPIHPCT
jgi:hypothetical protein